MEQAHILPQAVDVRGPTCLTALLVMAHSAAVVVSPEQAREVLSAAGVAWDSPAHEWADGLTRTLTLLTHPQGGPQHAVQ